MIRILLVGVGCLAASLVRFISEDPEFSWSGTLFIVGGFAVFGLAQSVVAVARRRLARRRMLTVFRAIGGVATLPGCFTVRFTSSTTTGTAPLTRSG